MSHVGESDSHAEPGFHTAETISAVHRWVAGKMLTIRRAVLEANGFSVLTASGAEAALEILENNVVNAAVIGDGQDEIDATSLARKIRKSCPRLPVMVLMRSSSPVGVVSETEIYVPKASGPKALLAAICQSLQGRTGIAGLIGV